MTADDPYRECRELHRRWTEERREEGLAAIASLYGVDIETARAWERARIRAHPDYVLTRLLRRMLASADPGATLQRDPKGRAALNADRPLQAYVDALLDAGPDAVREAADQLRDAQRRLLDDYAREIDPGIVRVALRQWRAWGQMIIDAEQG